jgi:Rod binding domain-containing protein
MSIAGINSSLTTSQIQPKAPELTPIERLRASHLKGAALRNAPAAEQRAAVASQFEAILVRQMLGKTITKMLGKEDGAATSVYGDLLTDTFATQLTAGQGLGLARMLERQLTPHGPAAQPPAA